MGEKSYTQRIREAHETGHLFAHMFEHTLEKGGKEEILPLFEVMNNAPDAHYNNGNYGSHYTSTPHGIVGLATTALKKEYPVPLFNDMSQIGLLMDTATPLLVSHYDGASRTEGTNFSFRPSIYSLQHEQPPVEALQQQLLLQQGFSIDENNLIIDIDGEGIDSHSRLAKPAVTALWEGVQRTGWKTYSTDEVTDLFRGMNEVDVVAKLQDICGIKVYDACGNRRLGGYREEIPYADSVKAAVELRQYLVTKYPDIFDTSLPVMSYELTRDPIIPGSAGVKLVELTPAKIQSILSSRDASARIL